MYFNSYLFILLFLPCVLLLYFTVNRMHKYTLGKIILLLASAIFYLWFNVKMLPLILISCIFNFYAGKFIGTHNKHQKKMLVFAIALNVAILGYFKYTNFMLESLNHLLSKDFTMIHILVPVGISFFTFQQICYLVDCKKETYTYSFPDYLLHVLFFPYIISGPIVKHDQIIPQFNDESKKKFNVDNFAMGLMAFGTGLAEKVLLADTLAAVANTGYADVSQLNATTAIIVSLSYTFQIFFDFSGYSNMVTGIGLMLNLKMPENFNSPYRACSINDFWKRWHMTLTKFFTQYVYIPLGGSRKGNLRTYVNIFIIFLLSGLWHGANWTFVVWGILHGVASILNRLFREQWEKLNVVIRWFITFSFVNFAWIFFRAGSLADAVHVVKCILYGQFGAVPYSITGSFFMPEVLSIVNIGASLLSAFPAMVMNVILLLCFYLSIQTKNVNERIQEFTTTKRHPVLLALLFAWALLSLSGIPTFIYVNF